MKIEISKRARRQIERINKWWVEQRPASPNLFLDELTRAEALLRASPRIGTEYTEHKSGEVRCVVLAKTKHYLYYRHRPVKNPEPGSLSLTARERGSRAAARPRVLSAASQTCRCRRAEGGKTPNQVPPP